MLLPVFTVAASPIAGAGPAAGVGLAAEASPIETASVGLVLERPWAVLKGS